MMAGDFASASAPASIGNVGVGFDILGQAFDAVRDTVTAVRELASVHGVGTAVLGGGVFQNRILLETTAAGLARAGLEVLVAERLPVNDGGIAYGQAAIAAARGS